MGSKTLRAYMISTSMSKKLDLLVRTVIKYKKVAKANKMRQLMYLANTQKNSLKSASRISEIREVTNSQQIVVGCGIVHSELCGSYFIPTNQEPCVVPAAFLSVNLPNQNRWFHVHLSNKRGGGHWGKYPSTKSR